MIYLITPDRFVISIYNLITVFSWNEWIEGGYLLPDMKYGFGHLEAVKRVIEEEYNPYPLK